VIIAPILGIISWVFMAVTGVLKPGDIGVPYPVYVLIGSSIWGLFMSVYGAAAGTLSAGGGFILQVNYPHDALLVKTVAQAVVNFAIVFSLNLVVITLAGYPPHWATLMLPLVTLPLLLGAAAAGLVMAVLGVVVPDLPRFAGMFFGSLFYVTPIVFSSKIENKLLQNIIHWNPMTYLVAAPRDLVIFGRFDHWYAFLGCAVVLTVSFLIAWRLFFIAEIKVIERL
jgi:lipopolysaccharide transport system permease protein